MTKRFADRAGLRAWLAKNHEKESELWLLLAKKHVPRPVLSYDETVEEALCFGWIDGQNKRFDDDYEAIRLTPRKPKSHWSESNKKRVERLIRERRMTPAGLALVEQAKQSGAWEEPKDPEPPKEMMSALRGNAAARAYFAKVPPGYRRAVIAWIAGAKKPETRARRIAELVKACAAGKRVLE